MDPILLGKGITDDIPVQLLPRYGNRHGLVAGATGTGKTVTLMTLAEGFSRIGVPVFLADVKGDVAGLAVAGEGGEKLLQRAAEIGAIEDQVLGLLIPTGRQQHGFTALPVNRQLRQRFLHHVIQHLADHFTQPVDGQPVVSLVFKAIFTISVTLQGG